MSLLAHQRARSATEIVDASAQFSRKHAIPLLAIVAIVIVPPAVIGVFVPLTVRIFVNIAGNLLLAVGGAAVSVYVVAVMQEGEIEVGEAFRRAKGRAGSVIASQIFYALAVFLGTLLLVVPGIIFLVRLVLMVTIAAVERVDSDKSARRSWALTKGYGMHAFRTVAIGIGLTLIVLIGGVLLMGLLAGALAFDESLYDVLIAPVLMVTVSFGWVVVTMLYIDLRIRVEAADIEAMAADGRPATYQTADP